MKHSHLRDRGSLDQQGFGLVGVLLIILVLILAGGTGVYIYHRDHKTKVTVNDTTTSTTTKSKSGSSTGTTPDPYAGWKSACDTTLKACYRYPSDWVVSKYGGYQNTTDTAYFNYQDPNTKDQASNAVYVADIEDVNKVNQNLKIVGYVLNNVPSYVMYDASVVSTNSLTVGQTKQLVTVNPVFTGKTGNSAVSFVATPGAQGIAAITNMDQAKAWFNTPEAKESLKILQSFYYQ